MKKPENKNQIGPAYSNGFRSLSSYIATGFVLLTLCYYFLETMFRNARIPGLPMPDQSYCGSRKTCYRSDLFAFQMTSGVAILLAGSMGFYTWHVSRRAHKALPPTPEGRLFGFLPEAEQVAAVNFTFQLWDFFISLLIREHRTAIMLSHHLLAATVAFCGMRFQYLHHYAVFFLGVSEVSSIFLVFIDLAKFFPPEPGTMYDRFVGIVCGPLFLVTFVLYRVLLWWPTSYRLYRDSRQVLRSGQASRFRPGKSWVLYLFLSINLPLGLMQLYWLTIIFDEAKKVLFPSSG